MTRVAFGADAEFLRRTQDDAVLQKASQLMQGSRTPRDVFAHIDQTPKTIDAPTSP
jgi:carboxyl-terminal processing protease